MGSYRKGLDLKEMRSAIKMIKRIGKDKVKESGKYGGMGGERIKRWGGWIQ